jgi:hypothetical protein
VLETLKSWLDHADMIIAGLFGAFVALPFHKDARASRLDAFVFLMSGGVCAHFLTPLVAAQFSIGSGSLGSVSFMLGAFGGSMIAAIIRAIQTADLWALVKSKFGGGQ